MSSREAAHFKIYFSFSVESHFTLQHIRDISLQYLTNRQLPLDASVNRPCKHFLSEKFQGWYAGKVEKKIKAVQNISDMGYPVLREVTSRWLIDFYQYTQKKAISRIGNGEYRNGERGTGNGERGTGNGESLK